jgi:hypothetical protein
MTDNCHLKVIARSGGNHTSDGANHTIIAAIIKGNHKSGFSDN